MVLITSAAYASPALVSEFGKLPPSFLPVQNKRLFYHQVKLFNKNHGQVCLSLPQNFTVDEADEKEIAELGCKVLKVPEKFSLGQSLVYCLSIIASFNEPLYILHGDTLFESITEDVNIFSIAHPEDEYSWAHAPENEKGISQVFSGFFSFSSQIELIRAITECEYDFIKGIKKYSEQVKVENRVLPQWLDFGLINSFYRSTSRLTTERAFNSLNATRFSITKQSNDKKKILGEAHWIKSIPTSMKHFVPSVWDEGIKDDKAFYTLEYLYLTSLANLFVFGRNSISTWNEILRSCNEFINVEASIKPSDPKAFVENNLRLFRDKTRMRLVKYCEETNFSLQEPLAINDHYLPPLSEILSELDSKISDPEGKFVSLTHGDFCFSNILYDFKSKSIRVLDPRGIDIDGKETLFGDFRYDVAKLAHSILGLYDLIIAGRFDFRQDSKYRFYLSFKEKDKLKGPQLSFKNMRFGNYTLDELNTYPIMIGLFLSMLPLHSDRPDRQSAMLANALRLYHDYKILSK